MPVPTWAIGQVLSAADVNNWFVPLTAAKTADQSVTSSTVLVNDSALFLTVVSGCTYWMTGYLEYEGAATGTGDIKWTWTVPGSTTFHYMATYFSTGATLQGGAIRFASDTLTAGTNGTTRWGVTISGAIIATASGTVQLRWAQNTSSGTPTIVHANSFLVAGRIN